MKKRLITAALSMAVAAASLSFSAFSSDAKYDYADNSSTEFFENLKENYMEVDFSMFRCSLTEGSFRDIRHEKLFLQQTENNYHMTGIVKQPDYLLIYCNSGSTEDDVEKVMQEYYGLNGAADYIISYKKLQNEELERVTIKSSSGEITTAEVKNISGFFKEKGIASQCEYICNGRYATDSYIYSDYLPYYYYLNDENIMALKNYIEENNYNWAVEDAGLRDGICVVPDYEATLEDEIEMVNKIYDDLGFTIDWIMQMSEKQIEDSADVLNSVEGDANNDGELELSDAIMVMQSVGNPDEFVLDVQQKFNADISGNGDGVTNMDALEIQQRLLGSF